MSFVHSAAVVAGESAVALIDSRGIILQHTVERLHIGGVEIDQVRLAGAVRVVAGVPP